MPSLDPAVWSDLGVDPTSVSFSSSSGSGFSSCFRVTAQRRDSRAEAQYFVKIATGHDAGTMIAGEFASLNAIAAVVPRFCPRAHAHGPLPGRANAHFLVTDWIDLHGGGGGGNGGGAASNRATGHRSLAAKLAALHTVDVSGTAGGPPDSGKPFGFPVSTCCGATAQDNTWTESWADFYADRRLRAILARCLAEQDKDDHQLIRAVERTASTVVPRLLRPGHLQRSAARREGSGGDGGGKEITPAVVHGDLWSGNRGRGRVPNWSREDPEGEHDDDDEREEVVYDPACVYGHSEYDLGIMRMFGGFGRSFWREYEALVPKDEPVAEWDDRVTLYELYHHLNHYALFGYSYRDSAMAIMRKLLEKYG
ncbi:phosphotransferase enzyme family protein [Niveomyces insectorum RCEF 264]|uniref:protein-ribulosamine 3-kinase n=1 Tax=Niveomyces insectorum RCEF 264 TaxID=1081102 RepID=A0A167Z696_9HYPO|nr:phosphotransferase enzyme family protein [Niveomyces insectorum RCEF 264]